MADRGMIFSAPMVKALLEGRKTMTRRIAKPQPRFEAQGCHPSTVGGRWWDYWSSDRQEVHRFKPPFVPGDRLWVREAHKLIASGEVRGTDGEVRYGVGYRADGATRWSPHVTIIHDLRDQPQDTGPMQFQERPWRSSIHMPRWASRLTLLVTEVRVQRLHEISEEDARAEGCEAKAFPGPWWQGYRDFGDGDLVYQQTIGDQPPDWMIEPHRMRDMKHLDRSARDAFRNLWDSIHGPDAWEANPWVCAVSFEVHRCNIDEMVARAAPGRLP